jgi:hypothetical protein
VKPISNDIRRTGKSCFDGPSQCLDRRRDRVLRCGRPNVWS